jgi:hypothetical protein
MFMFRKAEIVWLVPSGHTEATEPITTTRQMQINIYHIAPVSEVGLILVATLTSMSLVLLSGNKSIKNRTSVENT